MIKYLILGLALLLTACNPAEDNMSNYSPGGGWQQTQKMKKGGGRSAFTVAADFTKPGINARTKLPVDPPGAGAYTVQFGVSGFQAGAGRPYILADIVWMVGAGIKRTVSVQNGTSLTGVAEAVNVTVRDATPGAASAQTYSVTVLISKGNRGVFKQPPYLIPLIGTAPSQTIGHVFVPPSSSVTVDVPDDGGIISLNTNVAWNDSAIVAPILPGEAIVMQFGASALKKYDPRDQDWVPVVPNLESITLFNNNAGQPAGLMYSIAYGIDG
jgi:hypothetical protein